MDFQRVSEMKTAGATWIEISGEMGVSVDAVRKRYKRWAKQSRGVGIPTAITQKAPARIAHSVQKDPRDSAVYDLDNDGLSNAAGMDYKEWLTFLQDTKRRVASTQERRSKMQVTVRGGRKGVAVQFVSCWHLGSAFTNYARFQEHLDRLMAVDGLYWGIHGDEYDNFPAGFRSAEAVWGQLVSPKIQRLIVRSIIKELAARKKIIYACWSNHPGFTEQSTGENPMETIYAEHGVPYFDAKGAVDLRVGTTGKQETTQQYWLYVAHEFKGSSQWSKNAPQARALQLEFPQADVVAMGDKHVSAVQKIYPQHGQREVDAGIRQLDYSYLVQTGTAKDGPEPYSARGWSRGEFEWPTLVFGANDRYVKYVDDLEDLKYFIG